MKLCLFLVAGAALAAEDRTPPTISLTLPALTYADRNCATHPCTTKSVSTDSPTATPTLQNAAGKYESATCEYGSSASDCPLPTCKAFDHHDLHCKADDTACLAMTAAERDAYCHTAHGNDVVTGTGSNLSSQSTRSGDTNKYSKCTHEFSCVPTYRLINEDGTSVAAGSQTYSAVDRSLRSEWLITYDATDESNNHAESVSFAMIFQDTQAPSLETEFCKQTLATLPTHRDDDAHDQITVTADTTGTGGTTDDCTASITRKFAQSCTECQDDLDNDDSESFDKTGSQCADACVHSLVQPQAAWYGKGFYSEDNYDGNVTANVAVTLTSPDSTEVACTNGCTIDTHTLGTWTLVYTSNDNADMYGTGEANNEVKQTVTINVVDNRDPNIFVDDIDFTSQTDFNTLCSNADDPILECATGATYKTETPGTGTFTDPGATCKDLRESWTGTSTSTRWTYEHVLANSDIDNVNVATLDKTSTGNTQWDCTPSGATATQHYVNTYTITYDCDDGSTIPSANDATQKSRVIRVEDTTAPGVQLVGNAAVISSAGFNTHASNGGFEDHAGSSNSHDSVNCTGHQGTCNGADHTTGFLNWNQLGVGRETVDRSSNSGKADYVMNGHLGGSNQANWNGATCSDTCNTAPTMTATLHYGLGCAGALVTGDSQDGDLKNFPEFTAGDYSILYTCTDGDDGDFRPAMVHTACRNVTNVDATKPIIQILGQDVMTLEATHEGNYVDDGAVCYDQVDGVISQNVEVSGDVVNLAKVGKYIITYNCRDSAQNVAPTESRTVWVEQTTCPTCTVSGCDPSSDTGAFGTSAYNCTFRHEASFDYTDAGAACSDQIDGVVEFNTTNPIDVETTGEYVITYRAMNSVNRYNDDCGTPAVQYFRTVFVVDTLKPMVVVKYENVEVARGDATDTAVHDNTELNPARLYMAEEAATSHQEWAIGAVAAAVAGVALLALGARRSGVVTTVPV